MIRVRKSEDANANPPKLVPRMLTRVELNVHFHGALRHDSLHELIKQQGVPKLPGRGTLKELQDHLVVKEGGSVNDFHSKFDIITKVLYVRANSKILERVAYELVEDCAKQGVAYFEAQFCPHLLLPANSCIKNTKESCYKITEAIIKGLERGQKDFHTKGNLIATSIRHNNPIWYQETLEIAADRNFHRGRIVGIALAGAPESVVAGKSVAELSADQEKAIEFCKNAAELGLSRTIHAGEPGAAASVTDALDKFLADRIGHGYQIVQDPRIYERVKRDQIHLETCPWSSILTGSASRPTAQNQHPIIKFFQDDLNVSVNSEDPAITGKNLDNEYQLLNSWGLYEGHLTKASFNAAESSFLPEIEKSNLLREVSQLIRLPLETKS